MCSLICRSDIGSCDRELRRSGDIGNDHSIRGVGSEAKDPIRGLGKEDTPGSRVGRGIQSYPCAEHSIAPVWLLRRLEFSTSCSFCKDAPPRLRLPASDSRSHPVPITPSPTVQQRILVWGDAPLTDVAVEWLISHHYSAIITPESDPFQTTKASRRFSDRTVALSVADDLKADFVLFLEREESKEGALIEPRCDTRFYVNVDVRGVSVESGDMAVRGNAHYRTAVDLNGKTFRSLTCHALATAWGFRPSGQLDIPSGLMCIGWAQTSPYEPATGDHHVALLTRIDYAGTRISGCSNWWSSSVKRHSSFCSRFRNFSPFVHSVHHFDGRSREVNVRAVREQ